MGIGGVECASSLLPPFGAIKLIYGDEDTERSGAEIGGSARLGSLVGVGVGVGGRDFFYCRPLEFFFRRCSAAKKAKATPPELYMNARRGEGGRGCYTDTEGWELP